MKRKLLVLAAIILIGALALNVIEFKAYSSMFWGCLCQSDNCIKRLGDFCEQHTGYFCTGFFHQGSWCNAVRKCEQLYKVICTKDDPSGLKRFTTYQDCEDPCVDCENN